MDKLNNEELNKVSAGGDSHDVPSLEWVEVYLHNHRDHCKYCGTPVKEFEPFNGPLPSGKDQNYIFLCKCPYPRNLVQLTWWHTDGTIYIPDTLV